MYTVLFAEDTDVVRELFCEALRGSGTVSWMLPTAPRLFRSPVGTPARFIS